MFKTLILTVGILLTSGCCSNRGFTDYVPWWAENAEMEEVNN